MFINRWALVFFTVTIACAGYLLDRSPAGTHYGTRLWNDPQEILSELHQGNLRFMHSARTFSCDTAHDDQLRHESARGQHPFISILCCCDSRVCPEIIFDQRVGSIFEIRNAGNVVDDDVMASMEYAVEHLHVPVILILGHKGCGAIKAVCDAGDTPLHGHLHELQKHMSGLLKDRDLRDASHDERYYTEKSLENARQQAAILLKESSVIAESLAGHKVMIVYGIYDMVSGKVDFYNENR